MPNNENWEIRARRFLQEDLARLRSATSNNQIRVAIMDSHAVLENALRGYLIDKYGVEGLKDKSKFGFRSVVQTLRDRTGDAIIDSAEAEEILAFNALRNRVVHDADTASLQDVQSGLGLIAEILNCLLGDTPSYPSWQSPFCNLASQLGERVTYSLGAMMIIFSLMYIFNPLDIPGPIDDFGIAVPCLFSAVLLINAARFISKKAMKK